MVTSISSWTNALKNLSNVLGNHHTQPEQTRYATAITAATRTTTEETHLVEAVTVSLDEITQSAIISITGTLDEAVYAEVLAKGAQAILMGGADVIVDLQNVTNIDTVGMVALHNLARALNGKTITSPTNGWNALQIMAADRDVGLTLRLKLIVPQSSVMRVLERANMNTVFEIVPANQ